MRVKFHYKFFSFRKNNFRTRLEGEGWLNLLTHTVHSAIKVFIKRRMISIRRAGPMIPYTAWRLKQSFLQHFSHQCFNPFYSLVI